MAQQLQQMQDMFLNKFKKLKNKNKVLFHKALKKKNKSATENDEEISPEKETVNQRDQKVNAENSSETPILDSQIPKKSSDNMEKEPKSSQGQQFKEKVVSINENSIAAQINSAKDQTPSTNSSKKETSSNTMQFYIPQTVSTDDPNFVVLTKAAHAKLLQSKDHEIDKLQL